MRLCFNSLLWSSSSGVAKITLRCGVECSDCFCPEARRLVSGQGKAPFNGDGGGFRRRVRRGSGGRVATVPLRVFVCSLRALVGSVVYGKVGFCSSGYSSFVSSSSSFRYCSCLLARGMESSSLLCDCLSALHRS